MAEFDYEELRHRRGCFWLSHDFVRENTRFWQLIMSNILITRCEYIFDLERFEYFALSPLFDKCDKLTDLPEYQFSVNEYQDLVAKRIADRPTGWGFYD